jgi:hypothetical protein
MALQVKIAIFLEVSGVGFQVSGKKNKNLKSEH